MERAVNDQRFTPFTRVTGSSAQFTIAVMHAVIHHTLFFRLNQKRRRIIITYARQHLLTGVAGIVAVTLAMPDPKATVYAVVIGLVLYWLIERPNAAQRAKRDLSIIGDNTADIEAGDEHGVAQKS